MADSLAPTGAQKEAFAISEDKTTDGPGYYAVSNPMTRNEYRVVFRGKESVANVLGMLGKLFGGK